MTTATPVATTTSTVKPTIAPRSEAVTLSAMKITVSQENLKRGLVLALHAVAPRSTLPMLSNILIAAAGKDRIKLAAIPNNSLVCCGASATSATRTEQCP